MSAEHFEIRISFSRTSYVMHNVHCTHVAVKPAEGGLRTFLARFYGAGCAGEHQAKFATTGNPELGEEVVQVGSDRAVGEIQPLADFPV
jgi:hypothetical protein